MGLIAILSGPVIFMGIGVVIATGWAIFMCAVVGIPTEVRFTGPVMVTGCCRLTGDVMLTVLVAVLIWAVMVTALLELTLRFTAEVLTAELVTGVVAAELLCKLLASVLEKKKTNKQKTHLGLVSLIDTYYPFKTRRQQPSQLLGCGWLKISIHHYHIVSTVVIYLKKPTFMRVVN